MDATADWLLDDTAPTLSLIYEGQIALDTESMTFAGRLVNLSRTGLCWYDRVIQTKAAPAAFVPRLPDDEPALFIPLMLDGSTGITLPGGTRHVFTPSSHVRTLRARTNEVLLELPAMHRSHSFGASASPQGLADWFGGRLPAALRPFVTDRLTDSIDVPAFDGGIFRIMAATIATYREPLRQMACDALAMQMITAFLHGLAGRDAVSASLTAREVHAAQEAREALLADLRTPPSTSALAALAGMSERRLDHAFRTLFGASVFRTLANARLDHAYLALMTGQPSIKDLAFRLGYKHAPNFSNAFRARFGVYPTQLVR